MAACKLTIKQEAYAQARAQGMTQRQAYKAAYNTARMADDTIDNNAYVLERSNSEVATRIRTLRAAAEAKAVRHTIATAVDVLEGLTAIAAGDKTRDGDRIRALELLAKYHNLLTDKIDISGAVAAPDLSGLSLEELRELCGLKPPRSGRRADDKQIHTRGHAEAVVIGATREDGGIDGAL